MSLLSDHDLYLFNEGSHVKLHDRLGSHTRVVDGQAGTNFAVWAPDAERVTVHGSFNSWNRDSHPLHPRGQSGIWEGFIPGVGHGDSASVSISMGPGTPGGARTLLYRLPYAAETCPDGLLLRYLGDAERLQRFGGSYPRGRP